MISPYMQGYILGHNAPESPHKAKKEKLYKIYDPEQWERFVQGLQAGREESPNYEQ